MVARRFLFLILPMVLCANLFSQSDTASMRRHADSVFSAADQLLNTGKYDDALVAFQNYANEISDLFGEENPDYAMALHKMGNIYLSKNEYDKAMHLYKLSRDIRGNTIGINSADYSHSCYNIGMVYYNKGDYENALKYHLQALEIRKEVLGENNRYYSESLNAIGATYKEIRDYGKALVYFQIAMEIRKNLYGENSIEYLSTLNNIGCTYDNMGNYIQSLKIHLQILKYRKKILGENNPQYALSLNNIGSVYCRMGDYKNGLNYFLQALKIRENVLGKEHQDYALSLHNLGYTYLIIGDFQNALKYCLQAKEIRGKIFGENHLAYVSTLIVIGEIYERVGDNRNALKYQQKATDIIKKNFGEENFYYSSTLIDIGNIYFNMGDYRSALKYYLHGKEIRQKILGKEHPEYALLMNNISNAYSKIGEYHNALKYLAQAMEIQKNVIGEDHPDYAITMYNIARLYLYMGDYKTSLTYNIQALKIMENAYGKESPKLCPSYNNLGNVYTKLRDYKKAIEYYMKAIELQKKYLGENHQYYALSLRNIGLTYFDINDLSNALRYNKDAAYIYKKNLMQNFSFMTAHEREAYWNANNRWFSQNIMYTYNSPQDTLATKTSYDTELITKGLLLASEISITNTIMESGDTALISEYEDTKIMHLQLNKELERPISERNYDCDSLENEIQKHERHIVERCKEFGDITHFIKIDWQEVRDSLKPNEVAIEFANFTENDTTRYLALMLTKDMDAPSAVYLFNDHQIGTGESIYEGYDTYDLIWKPLESHLPPNADVYFAPSGILNRINIEVLLDSTGTRANAKWNLHRVSSTRVLCLDTPKVSHTEATLYGGLKYDTDTSVMIEQSRSYASEDMYASRGFISDSTIRAGWKYLPATKTEVESIASKMKTHGMQTNVYTENVGTEESFKALSGKRTPIIHLATHGFFFKDEEVKQKSYFEAMDLGNDMKQVPPDNSLLRSGLVLSGGQHAWLGEPIPDNVEDGILLAKEIASMDLRGTDLVVLSACETGLGEITNEGVFGLQRAFKKAGVQTLIMSLWKVDDSATALMMQTFYANLLSGKSKRESFLNAQETVRLKYEEPHYWAGFIMLD